MSSRSPFHSLIDNKFTRGILQRSGAQNPMVRRYIAGDQLSDALQVTGPLREGGYGLSLDYLGPEALNPLEIKPQVEQYHDAVKAISTFCPGASLHVRLSSLGLMRSAEDVTSSLPDVLNYAVEREVSIIIGAETFDYTEDTVALARNLSTLYTGIGVVVQSNQRRSDDDIKNFLADGNRIRLTKGYGPIKPIDGLTRPEDIDRQFRRQLFELIDVGHATGKAHIVCTHDPVMIDAAKLYIKKQGYDLNAIGFTFLYGVRNDLQQQTQQQGYDVTLSVPYGPNWYPYFSQQTDKAS